MKSKASTTMSRATGPRTPAGKRRSSKNAVSHGFWARHVILDGESRTEFENLHQALRKEWQPTNATQAHLVEYLAVLIWRRQRPLAAENAIISRTPRFLGLTGRPVAELPNQSLLRVFENDYPKHQGAKPEVILQAMSGLWRLAGEIRTRQLDFATDLEAIYEIYGVVDVISPESFVQRFIALVIRASVERDQQDKSAAVFDYESEAGRMLQDEISHLHQLFTEEIAKGIMQNSLASLIPRATEIDPILRCETHLGRLIEKTINQLLQLKAISLGSGNGE
jgi:hypothetical protein